MNEQKATNMEKTEIYITLFIVLDTKYRGAPDPTVGTTVVKSSTLVSFQI